MDVIKNGNTFIEGRKEIGLTVNFDKTEYILVTGAGISDTDTLACKDITFNGTVD